MTDELISNLKDMPSVETLHLNSNIITDEGTKHIYENIPNIKNIKLNNSTEITYKGLFLLTKNLKKLEAIDFKNLLPFVNYYQ